MRKKCTDYYNQEIKPTYLINVEGEVPAKECRRFSIAQSNNNERFNKTLFAWSKLQKPENIESDALTEFLNIDFKDPRGKVWLIQGKAKTGKTLLLRGLEFFIWNKYAGDYTEGYIPIYVCLAETKNPNDCFTSLFNSYGNAHSILKDMKDEIVQKYLFILDGFDDLRSQKTSTSATNLSNLSIPS